MCFNAILENFRLSKSFEKREYVSEHWNVFNTNFDKVITNKKIWERMLRNALTLGLNDNLTKISNERFVMADYNLWERLKSGEYDDLIFDIQDEDKTSIKFHENNFGYLCYDLFFCNLGCSICKYFDKWLYFSF